jgi:outer membrane protein OmpA-like peptidoglycan-associated protein
LDIKLDFTEGYKKPLASITAEIQSLQESNNNFSRELSSLRDQNAMMEERLSKYTDTEKELQQMIALKKSQEKKVQNINKSFTKDEGQVFLDGDKVILRLYGLTFPTGKSEIKPEYFALLKKVQDGIREFENCDVIIEGHTDSRGGAELNQTLSDERANAVQAYIVSNMSFPPDRIKSVGFGESKPVANNETEAGRAKNRRIDVVIIPGWAQNQNEM